MARSTWGSILEKKKGPDGIYLLRYTVNGKAKSETVRGSRSDADRRLAELRIKYEGGIGENPVLCVFWDIVYHPWLKSNLAPKTVEGYEQKYYHDIEPEFGLDAMDEIRPRRIQKWIDSMPPSTARHAKAVFSSIFSYAFANEYVDDDPLARRYRMPKKSDTDRARSKAVMPRQDADEVAALCHGEPWEAPFILSRFGGASRHEAVGVQAPDVRMEGAYAVVFLHRGVHRVSKIGDDGSKYSEVVVTDDLKNEFRYRELVVEPPHSFRLWSIAQKAQAEAEANGWDDAWLCGDGLGWVMCPNAMAQSFRRWFSTCRVSYVPFGNLRNSYATDMLSRGVDGSMVSKMIGNNERSTTEKHYERPCAADFIAAIESSRS